MYKKTNTSYFGSLTRISDLNTKSFAICKVPHDMEVEVEVEVEGKNKEDTSKEWYVELIVL